MKISNHYYKISQRYLKLGKNKPMKNAQKYKRNKYLGFNYI